MFSLLVSILALGAIIAFHEFGHFSIARLFGVGVIEYAVGMGPRIWSTIKGNTRYSLRAIPFGGFCMMLSEDLAEPDPDPGEEGTGSRQDNVLGERDPQVVVTETGIIYEGRYFSKDEQFAVKPAWQRFLVILAGPVFNFILAFVLALIITGYNGYDRSVIREVDPGFPAAQAGIEAGDIVTAIAVGDRTARPEKIETARDIMLYMSVHQDVLNSAGMMTMYYQDVSDGNRACFAELTPVYDEALGRYRIGFSYSGTYEKADTPGEILYYSWYNVKFNFRVYPYADNGKGGFI